MKKISKFLYGKDYSEKLDKFNKAIDQIHAECDGEFDTSGYFTMQTHNQRGEVKLDFGQNKNIPTELKENVLKAFKEIWKIKTCLQQCITHNYRGFNYVRIHSELLKSLLNRKH